MPKTHTYETRETWHDRSERATAFGDYIRRLANKSLPGQHSRRAYGKEYPSPMSKLRGGWMLGARHYEYESRDGGTIRLACHADSNTGEVILALRRKPNGYANTLWPQSVKPRLVIGEEAVYQPNELLAYRNLVGYGFERIADMPNWYLRVHTEQDQRFAGKAASSRFTADAIEQQLSQSASLTFRVRAETALAELSAQTTVQPFDETIE